MKKIFICGGYVRDRLLGRVAKDIDYVVVGATPEEMLADGFVQVGADFPVFLHPETREEYALARRERKVAAGYHGFETEFDVSVTLKEDLSRRDLTINAMAMDDEGNIIDPFNGYPDLSAGILRHTTTAFAEDPLRVLRVARFVARYKGFKIADETMELMKDIVDAKELEHLSKERIYLEFIKAMSEADPFRFIACLKHSGALKVVFPELYEAIMSHSVRAIIPVINTLTDLESPTQRMAYLLMLAVRKEAIDEISERMKIPNEVKQLAKDAFEFRTACGSSSARSIVELFDVIKGSYSGGRLWEAQAMFEIIHPNLAIEPSVMLRLHFEYLSVSFESLTEDQRSTLKGKAIGEAIKAERINRITDYMRKNDMQFFF